ncbi:linear amide C-N hydrolase, partial [Streptococcus danieliae]|nr:linear amide C-N hydrolase [Streptococcus danieliae]
MTTKDHYLGRNFDYEFSYGEKAVIIPRNYVFELRKLPALSK